MITPEQILRSLFIDLGLVSYPTLPSSLPPCYTTTLPTDPPRVVTIKTGRGRNFGRQSRDGKRNLHCGVMIIIRALNDNDCFELANTLAAAMDSQMTGVSTTPTEDKTAHFIDNVNRSPIVFIGEEIKTKYSLRSIDARIVFSSDEPSIG